MTTKLTLWTMLGMLCLATCFSGCQSSKIAYGNSYYFKQTPTRGDPAHRNGAGQPESLAREARANQGNCDDQDGRSA